jgi:hypothetical protein
VGLDKLNVLAEACAANDTAAAFAMIDGILEAGVAIEQFVIDMAGYYRSLLLLKNGVTRESLLGYAPDRFSALALNAMDSIRLERALDILLSLYRDIRYSVSPRFELETAVSKLSWLTRWIPPPELRAAVMSVRDVLGSRSAGGTGFAPGGVKKNDSGYGGNSGFGGPASGSGNPLTGLGGGAPLPVGDSGFSRQGDTARSVFDSPLVMEKPGSLAEEFKRRMAARESAKQKGEDWETGLSAGTEPQGDTRLASGNSGDSGFPEGTVLPAGTELPEGAPVSPGIPPQVEMVRRFFGGDIVEIHYTAANSGGISF